MRRFPPLIRLVALLALLSGLLPLFAAAPKRVAPVLQPVVSGYSVLVGQPMQFSVTVVAGTAPFRYQWLHNGKTIAGAISTTYQIANITYASAGNYSVTVKNTYGSAKASFGNLTVNGPPVVLTQPQATTPAIVGYGALLGVTADNTTTSYQWYHNGQPIPYVNNAIYLNNVSPADAGNYSVILSNPWGNTTTKTVSLAVENDPHPNISVPGLDGAEYGTTKPRNGKAVPVAVVELRYAPQVSSVKLLGVQVIGGVVNVQVSSYLSPSFPFIGFPGYYEIPVPFQANESGWYVVTADGRVIGPPVEIFD